MIVQVNVWVSRELATWLMENYVKDSWVTRANKEDTELAKDVGPIMKGRNSAFGQFGSLFPKLLYLYELPHGSKFLKANTPTTEADRNAVRESLAPYYEIDIGADARFDDWDQMIPYPYLDEESEDYFVTHNIRSMYACEDFLRLIRKQLQNISSEHCFMAEIRAFEPAFDLCYQSISVNNPKALQESPVDMPTKIERCWLANSIKGYCPGELSIEVPEVDWPENDSVVPASTVVKSLAQKGIPHDRIKYLEIHEQIEWHEPFGDKYYCLFRDLIFNARGYSTSYCIVPPPQVVSFNWGNDEPKLDKEDENDA